MQDDSEWIQIPNVKTHYNETNATKHVHCYILDSNSIVNHKQKTSINHVEQSLINIDFNKKFDTNIVFKVHAVFADHTQFLKMTENTSSLIKDTENFHIPIGKIIDSFFKGSKPINYEQFLKLYQFILG